MLCAMARRESCGEYVVRARSRTVEYIVRASIHHSARFSFFSFLVSSFCFLPGLWFLVSRFSFIVSYFSLLVAGTGPPPARDRCPRTSRPTTRYRPRQYHRPYRRPPARSHPNATTTITTTRDERLVVIHSVCTAGSRTSQIII